MFGRFFGITFPRLLVCFVLCAEFALGKWCPCNYGGLCLDDQWPVTSCKCGEISRGVYEDNCFTLVNHCDMVTCLHGGTCVPIIGGYFCTCPEGHYGQKCEFTGKKLWNEEVYVYYQVQPAPNQEPFMVIIYGGEENANLDEYHKRLIFTVKISDGRIYYPLRQAKRVKKNWKQQCVDSASEFVNYFDPKVCGFLPDREEWGYGYTLALSSPIVSGEELAEEHNLYNFGRLVGKIGFVEVALVLSSKTAPSTYDALFKHRMRIFNYYVSRVAHNCFIEFKFRGCSAYHKYPLESARSQTIKVIPFIRMVNCTGTLKAGYRWYLQKHVDNEYFRDSEPLPEKDLDDMRDPTFPTKFFDEGTHMIEMKLILRGNPPTYGGSNEFSKVGRCWIKIMLGPVSVRIDSGRFFTTSCYTPLTLNFISSNPSYHVTELKFTISCNYTNDPDCEKRLVTVPYFTKLTAPCNKIYSFKIEVQSRMSEGPHSRQNIEAIIHFIKPAIITEFQCIFNCYPIDPQYKVIGYVKSTPYSSHPVNWVVKLENREIKERDGQILAFYPLSASRFIRIVGTTLTEAGEVLSEISFEARGSHGCYTTTLTHNNNLYPYTRNFTIQLISDRNSRYQYIKTGDLQPFIYVPIVYRIYQNNNYIRSSLVVLETNHLSLLTFKADWKEVKLCIKDSTNAQACTDITFLDYTIKTEVDLKLLEEKIEDGDVSRFLTNAVLYLYHGLMDDPSKPLKWKLDLESRIDLMNLALKPRETRTRDLAVLCNLISMTSYSEEGNTAEDLHPFINEVDKYSDYQTVLSWMEMRKSAMKVFLKATTALVELARRVFLRYTYGDSTDEMFQAWSLAHVQGNIVEGFQKHVNHAHRDFLLAELVSLERSIDKSITFALHKFMVGLSMVTRLFYGLRTYGRQNTRAWILTTSYRGVLVALNKTIKRDTNETLEGYTDYIFGPPQPVKHWYELIEIQMPHLTEELDSDEFSFIVMVAINRPGDDTVSPFIYIRLIRKGGVTMPRLPSSEIFSVCLPKMMNGKVVKYATGSLSFVTLVKPGNPLLKQHNYSVYKVSLPTNYTYWEEQIYMYKPAPLKMKITFDALPEYEEVEAMPELNLTFDVDTRFYTGKMTTILPENTSYIDGFYLGLVLSNEYPTEVPLVALQHTDVIVCTARETDGSDYEEDCEVDLTDRKVNVISCHCQMFGMISARSLPIRRTRIFMDEIEFITPAESTHNEVEFIPVIILVVIIATVIPALFLDRARQKPGLIYVEDAYPGDKKLLVVGVYTSVRFLAGTTSTVAIKIIGAESSSRVHLLRTSKRKRFIMGHDDWFVVTTKVPLGKITEIIVWHDFYNLSDWHCSQIYVYDLSNSKWYHVNVERWFCIHPSTEDSKIASFTLKEIESVEGMFISHPYKFSTHYINELRNCHIAISLLYLRKRSLTSFEQRSCIMLIKLLAICFIAWVAEEYLTVWVYGRALDREAAKELLTVDSNTLWLAFCILVLSAPFTLPVQLAYRNKYKSKLLQKKITNPIYMQLTKPEDLVMTSRNRVADDAPQPPPAVKKVGFRLTNPDIQQFRRVTRLVSNVIQKQIAWTNIKKAALGRNWRKMVLTLFGPAQFYCVNINTDIFRIKTRRQTIRIRIMAACIMTCFLLAISLILNLTNIYYELEVVGFLALMALVMDVLLLDPMYIFFHSLWMFYCLKTSNKESYLWNEEAKIRGPKPLEFVQYSTTATKKEYKPLSTDEIEKKRKTQQYVSTVKVILFYCSSFLAIFCATNMINHDYGNKRYYTTNGILRQIEGPTNTLRRTGRHINSVESPTEVMDYIATSLAGYVLTWYNSKNISNHPGRWARDFISKPIGSSNMIIQFIPKYEGDVRIKKIFEEYFEFAAGYVTESNLATYEVTLGVNKLNLMSKTNGWITGKSRDRYPLKGHNLTLDTSNFRNYYSNLLNVLGDLMGQSRMHIPRAIIYSTNYINSYARAIITVDVIHEFLPSGVCTAKIHVDTFPAYEEDEWIHTAFSNALLFFVSIHFVLTINEFVKHEPGIKAYFFSMNGVLKLCIYPLCTFVVVLQVAEDEEKALENIIHLPHYRYIDLHYVYVRTKYEAFLVLVVLMLLVLDSFFAVWRKCGYYRLKQTMTARCVHVCAGIFMLQLYILLNFNVCANSLDIGVFSLEVPLLLKDGTTIQYDYNRILLLLVYFTLFVFQKSTAAVFLANYFYIERQIHQESTLKQALETMRMFPRKTSVITSRKSTLKSLNILPRTSKRSTSLSRVESSHSVRAELPKKYLLW